MIFLHLFQCPEIGNVIPNMFYLCIMGRDHESGKPMSLSENQFLLDEGLLIVIFLTFNKHVLGACQQV